MDDNSFPCVIEGGYNTSYINSLLTTLFYKKNEYLKELLNGEPTQTAGYYLQELIKSNYIEPLCKNYTIKNDVINEIRNISISVYWKNKYNKINLNENEYQLKSKMNKLITLNVSKDFYEHIAKKAGEENKNLSAKTASVNGSSLVGISTALANNNINEAHKVDPSEYVELYRNDDFILTIPLTHSASKKYGSDAKWCTTKKDCDKDFKKHLELGVLGYVVIRNNELKERLGSNAFAIYRLFGDGVGRSIVFDDQNNEYRNGLAFIVSA